MLHVFLVPTDSADNLVMGGFQERGRDHGNAFFARYSGRDGSVIWENRFGSDEAVEQSGGLLIDEADDVIATVRAYGSAGFNPIPPAFRMLKLAGNSGAVVSEYTELTFGGLDLASDGKGGIAVTGGDTDLVAMLLRDEPRARVVASVDRTGVVSLRWPERYLGWRLDALRNSNGISPSGWTVVAGSTTTNSITVPIENGAPPTFYRLVQP